MIKSNLRDDSGAYTLVSGTMIITGEKNYDNAKKVDEKNKED